MVLSRSISSPQHQIGIIRIASNPLAGLRRDQRQKLGLLHRQIAGQPFEDEGESDGWRYLLADILFLTGFNFLKQSQFRCR